MTPAMSLREVLFQSLRHFVHLDESNAAVHCAPVRYSPITFRLAEHLAVLPIEPGQTEPLRVDDFVNSVLSHVGEYAEDTGR